MTVGCRRVAVASSGVSCKLNEQAEEGRAATQNAFQLILAQSVCVRAPSAAAGGHHSIGGGL
jgi:hypothetical protein